MTNNRVTTEYLYIEGRNPVLEAIKSGTDIEKIFISKHARGKIIEKIVEYAKHNNINIIIKDKKQMDKISTTLNNQGVIAVMPPYQYKQIQDILDTAYSKKESPFIVVLDGIEDPQNLGSIIRTAECLGAHGIIIPKRRAAQVTAAVLKVSAGAAHYMSICRVTNIANTIDKLKQHNIWVVGADMYGDECLSSDLKGPIALVIGNEGKGLGRLVRRKCDFVVSIPMKGHIQSLNASVAAGVLMYEVVRQRRDWR